MKAAFEAEKSNKAKLQQDMDKLRAFYDSKLKTMDGHLAHLPSTAQGKCYFNTVAQFLLLNLYYNVS